MNKTSVRYCLKFSTSQRVPETDLLFKQLNRTTDKGERWQLLKMHIGHNNAEQVHFAAECYRTITDAFLQEEYRPLRHATDEIEMARKTFKRMRRREIIGLRKIDAMLAMEKNTWYFLANNAVEQILYCLKRINDPCREHIANNFSPVPHELAYEFVSLQNQVLNILQESETIISTPPVAESIAETTRANAERLQKVLSDYRKQVMDMMQQQPINIESTTIYLNVIQESQQLLSCLRHLLRGMSKLD